jgi:hypothetical protein
MTYQSPYGKIAGLRERLDQWIERLASDRHYAWAGTGIIDDLEAMGRYMDGERTDADPILEIPPRWEDYPTVVLYTPEFVEFVQEWNL